MTRPSAYLVRSVVSAAILVLAGAIVPPAVAEKRPAAAVSPAAPAAAGLGAVGVDYEARRLLAGADRIAGLEQAAGSVTTVLRGDLEPGERAAARVLAGRIQYELGRFDAAQESFHGAADADARGPFVDDAEFAAIEALEAQGRDADAAREWGKWEKRFPQSPLRPAARLAQAWNALRRGDVPAASKQLASLEANGAWVHGNARVALASATALYLTDKPAEALAALGPSPRGAGASYLRALCFDRQGVLLKAAAAYQDVAERYPDSPLRDHALLGKACTFLNARDYRSAAEEFARVATRVEDPRIRAEAELRSAGSVFLCGAPDSALTLLRGVAERSAGTEVAARAQFLIGEVLASRGEYAEAIVEYNRLLANYFEQTVAASAQYRVARALDALGRHADATGSYQAVVRGYPLEPEAPAAAYLAGVGLLRAGRPLVAAPYFQLVLDRYAVSHDPQGRVVFASPAHQELVEAALCLLEYSYHRAGNLGQLTGAPHLLLTQLPDSRSPWRAQALLVDADAMAAQARYPEAQGTLERLIRDFPDLPASGAATKLLAWTYARQGRDSLAIATEERLIARGPGGADPVTLSAAFLDIAHERFNQKRYRDAAAAYEDFLRRYPDDPRRALALYQAGLCYVRLDRAGDAVDRWESVVRDSPSTPLAERAWARAGDVYFQAEKYDAAKRCYEGLLRHFSGSSAASLATLRLAQCEYNAGHDAKALELFSATTEHFPGTPAAREASRGTERALYRLSQSPRGAEVLARLVEQYPTSAFTADAQFQIGKRQYQEKHYRDAADAFRRVVSQFPGYSAADQAQFLIADAQQLAGDRDAATQAYEQFLSYFPNSELAPTASFRLGLLRFEAKDPMRAAVAFTRALDDSASAEVRLAARYNLALCQRLLGQTEDARVALEHYRADVGDDARAADVAYQLGDIAEAAGRDADARGEYRRGLAAHPRAALAVELHLRLGRVCERLGEKSVAQVEYQAAAASPDRDGPFRLAALARLAALYEAKKDYPRAVAAYRDIVRNARDPELVTAAQGRVSQLVAGDRTR